ncbi:hypothetical protein Bca4012_010611 [Brassica carinata]
MEVGSATKLRCQRIGCNAMFTDDDNPEGSCQFHASKGKHTTEKPVLAKPAPRQPITVPTSSPVAHAATKDSCSRCRQGFFCSDHGSQPKEQIRQALNTTLQAQEEEIESLAPPPPVKKVVIDINEPQVCKNKGCGKTFKERDNHETACSYHPGPPAFHDRLRGVRLGNAAMFT